MSLVLLNMLSYDHSIHIVCLLVSRLSVSVFVSVFNALSIRSLWGRARGVARFALVITNKVIVNCSQSYLLSIYSFPR